MAFGEVEQRVQDAGFGAVETCGAQGVEEHGAQEGAVEVGGRGCHFAAGWWGWVVGLVVWWVWWIIVGSCSWVFVGRAVVVALCVVVNEM